MCQSVCPLILFALKHLPSSPNGCNFVSRLFSLTIFTHSKMLIIKWSSKDLLLLHIFCTFFILILTSFKFQDTHFIIIATYKYLYSNSNKRKIGNILPFASFRTIDTCRCCVRLFFIMFKTVFVQIDISVKFKFWNFLIKLLRAWIARNENGIIKQT